MKENICTHSLFRQHYAITANAALDLTIVAKPYLDIKRQKSKSKEAAPLKCTTSSPNKDIFGGKLKSEGCSQNENSLKFDETPTLLFLIVFDTKKVFYLNMKVPSLCRLSKQ